MGGGREVASWRLIRDHGFVPEPLTPDPFDIDKNLIAVVRTLLAWRGATIEATAAAIGMGKSTMYQRLAPWKMGDKHVPPTPFLAREVWRLAQFFGVHVGVMYRDVERLIEGTDAHNGAPATKS